MAHASTAFLGKILNKEEIPNESGQQGLISFCYCSGLLPTSSSNCPYLLWSTRQEQVDCFTFVLSVCDIGTMFDQHIDMQLSRVSKGTMHAPESVIKCGILFPSGWHALLWPLKFC